MNTYFAQLRIARGDEQYREVDVSMSADSFSNAMRMLEVWQSAIEASLPHWKVVIVAALTHKRKGSDPIPLLAGNLLVSVFDKLDLSRETNRHV